MKILYLENHAIFAQQVISQFLKSHQVMVFPSLAAARQALASEVFDLVLCDYDLDDGKGDEFVRECRGPTRTGVLPALGSPTRTGAKWSLSGLGK